MKTVHIISHSHWDREWYLPYEKHHMLLVELIDDVLELFETDPDFKSFFLDGQTIALDDYLEVRPEKEALLKKHIENGKLRIGPFYILPDAFLTSSEANVRNMLLGDQESKKWGQKSTVGYYPDTFGNVGQTPQMMSQLGLDVAAFGRGVKPTGFANRSTEEDNFVSSYSEMNWTGADGTDIIGLLFANWYSNGNEIPVDKEAAKAYWDQKLEEAEMYASTNQLLFLNGVDHQPVQKDVSEAIKVANELYPEYNFIHSNFDDYLRDMVEELPEDLDTVEGELTSQETEGWYTLTNTASSRTYLKQEDHHLSVLLEQIAEPLATMAYEVTGEYPHDQLEYAWKIYMQNHPHDSICGCSVDEVHEEMMTRYQKAKNVGEYIIDEALEDITSNIQTENAELEEATPFVVYNTSGTEKSGVAKIDILTDKVYFAEKFPTITFDKIKNEELKNYKVVDENGQQVEAEVADLGPYYDYNLPKDGFREPFIARRVSVELPVRDMDGYSWTTFYLLPIENKENETQEASEDLTLKNEWLSVNVNKNGTINVTDLKNNKEYTDLLIFEDVGDIGNEYVFKQPNDEEPIYSTDNLIEAKVTKENPFSKEITLIHEIEVPLSADERLEMEQQAIIEFRNRKAQRVKETKPLQIETKILLERDSKHLAFSTTLTNEMKDHRIRVMFPTGIQTDVHYADSIFETVKRNNDVSDVWTNPTNPQRTHHFVNVRSEEAGMVIAPQGLNEYEIVEENNQQTIAITLLRAVGEMGDWGYFPTPEAQCLDTYTFDYYLSFHGEDDVNEMYEEAIHSPVPFITRQTSLQEGTLKATDQFMDFTSDSVAITALKRNKGTDDLITRFYNFMDEESDFEFKLDQYRPNHSNILEEKLEEATKNGTINPFEIKTYIWEKLED